MDQRPTDWLDRMERGGAPIYRALAAALEAAIRSGELQAGERLPPQRAVAERLGVDLTTVTRAWNAARARGLVEGTVGRGTFVRARAAEDDAGLVDLTMNLPPPPLGVSLAALIAETTAAILQRTDVATLMAYHPGAGSLGQKAAAAAWLAPSLGAAAPERLLVAAGAQSAIAATLSALCQPGDAVLAEPLTYPGVKAAADQLRLRLVPCRTDREGPDPDAFERACREARPAAAYLLPTMQNPTATTMSEARRRRIAGLAEAHGLWIIEDDPYARLMSEPPPAIASFAPERTIHIATLSKCLSPGLRVAFVACPAGAVAARIEAALRAVSLMAPPLMTAVVTVWIREGRAEELLAGVRAEATARRALAAAALPKAVGAAQGLHVWLALGGALTGDRLRLLARDRGLSLVTADAFAIAEPYPAGVRISLGGPARRATLAGALAAVADIVRGGAPAPALVV